MTNKQVSDVCVDIYNGFWMKHRDKLPELDDIAGWDAIVDEGKALIKQHGCRLATDMVADFLELMDQRRRGEGYVSVHESNKR